MPRPRVLTNFAITADGKISTRNSTPAVFSSARDKQRLLEIRVLADALLVGRGTAEKDQMSMTIPDGTLQAQRLANGKSRQPLRVLISESGQIPPTLKVFTNPAASTHVYATEKMPAASRDALSPVATLHLLPGDRLDLREVLQNLQNQLGVQTIVCEGGPTLLFSLLAADLVDEMFLTIVPVIFGGQNAPSITGLPGAFLPASREFQLKTMHVEHGECYTHYIRQRPAHVFG